MNFAAYNELRLMGYDCEAAAKMAETHQPIGMYEEKAVLDSSSHSGFTRVIGLKKEFKQMALSNHN